ncbi:MAG: GNAT family N-acetyltransferase [Flavobacteriaceae bacterium]|nr:GNAT family N-acetyltransferase [Flavobacteriaceae bacterium]
MEYHADRFDDFSMMVHRNDKLVAIIPANVKEGQVFSHAGLTYGGIISKSGINNTEIGEILDKIVDFLNEEGKTALHFKIMPSFLQGAYSNALEYFLFLKKAELTGRDMNYVVDLRNGINIHKSKLKKLKSIEESSLRISETEDLGPFWDKILIPVLEENHGVKPVHSLEEISKLRSTFPKNIIQMDVYHNEEIVAGMTLFISKGVVKSQYGAASIKGKELRALDYLYLKLFEAYIDKGFHYFDMGTSTVAKGASYNVGLSKYKEEFGALPVNLDHYKLSL